MNQSSHGRRSAFLPLLLLLCLPVSAPAQDAAQARDLAKRAEECLERHEFDRALDLAEQAIRLDPECALAYGARGQVRRSARRHREALNDLDTALRLDPSDVYLRTMRCFLFQDLSEFRSMYEEASTALKSPGARDYLPRLTMLRGLARVNLGEVDAGLAEMDQAVAQDPQDAILYRRFDAYVAKADWQALLREVDLRARVEKPLNPIGTFYQVWALCELGRLDEALDAIRAAQALFPAATEVSRSLALVYGTAGTPHHDLDRAIAEVQDAKPFGSLELNVYGRALVQGGRFREAIAELGTKGNPDDFQTAFLLAVASHGVGDPLETRRWLKQARRLNPYVARHAEKVAGLAAVLAAIDRDLAGDEKGDRIKIVDEQAKSLLSVAEIETLVRRGCFAQALAEYGRYRDSLTADSRRKEVERRMAELAGLDALMSRFCKQLNESKLSGIAFKVGTLEVTVKTADADGYEFTFKQGSGKASWASLGTETLLEYLGRAKPTGEETVSLGLLAWDAGLAEKGFELLQRATKDKADLRKRVDGSVASRRGIDAPAGGFVAYKGRFVTPEEKANLEKGLVLFEGQWVPVADREKLAKGLVKVDNKWVSGEEGKLLAAGYKQFKGRWCAREEYESLRGKWENASELTTTHFDIRTNRGDEFAASLGKVAEAAYTELGKFYDGKEPKLPGKERLTLWAFATFEDYRKYCVEHKQEDHLQAAGFASSDTNVVVGWDKTASTSMFLQTMAHEAAHLYYFRIAAAAHPPSWYAEGMATQLEGMVWNGKGWDFDRVSQSRLPFVKQAMRAGTHLPLAELVAGDALKLINSEPQKALLFYAESWALVYFLTHANQPKHREAFTQYREAIDAGGAAELKQFFPDFGKLEADFVLFVQGM